MADREIAYTPSPTLDDFHASNAFVRGIKGPIGSGKSVGCCWEIYTRALEQLPGPDGVRRSRWVVTRNTYGELQTTTLQTWLDWFPEEHVGNVVHGAPITQTCRFVHEDGSRVELEMWFLALDRPEHVKKLLSLEITGAWMNEAREQPKAILDALTGRVGRYPSKRDGGATWHGVILDTNPPDTDHWWYKLAEEGTPEGFVFFSQPPGDSPQAENVANLPAGYYDRLKAGKTEEWIRVYVRGVYGFVLDGKAVFPEFNDAIHVGPVQYNPALPVFVGIDFGLTPAAVLGQRDMLGRWWIFDELVSQDMGAKRFGELLHDKLVGEYSIANATITGDPSGDSRAQSDETTPFEMLKVSGVLAKPAPTNDSVVRREALAAPMSRLVDGKPGIIIDPRCRTFRKALAGGYCYKRVAVSGTERFHDAPDKNHFSHVAEAGEYMVLGAGEGRVLVRRKVAGVRARYAEGTGE